MASVFTHAALPLLAGRALRSPEGKDHRRLAVAAAVCSVLPDLDLIGVAFEVRPEDLLGHRGLTHSLFVAAALALVVAGAGFRRDFGRSFAFLFAAVGSHGLVDTLTRGELGVALFAPLSDARFHAPFLPIPSALGMNEYLGTPGLLVLFNELLFVVGPVWLTTTLLQRKRPTVPAAVWAAAVVAALAIPSLRAQTHERVIKGYGAIESDDDLDWILRDPLPEGRLVTRFDELQPFFGQRLEPANPPWSSGFFPAWFGSVAGRWRDSKLTLIGRTLGGFAPPTPEEAKRWLEKKGEGLGPTEKYDLSRGDLGFAGTTYSLELSHNRSPLPRFWYGVCVGVANAAVAEPEPFRAVEVETAEGERVRFHPVDVKALLGEAYYWQAKGGTIGGPCEKTGFDVGAECSMNPGGLVIGTLNYLGRARRSFVLDVHPTAQSQYYAVAAAKLDVVRAPYAPSDEPFAAGFRERVAQLVDVDFHFELSSTVLSVEAGDVPEGNDPTRFQKVGVHPVPFDWKGTIALDAAGDVIGGRWRGDPANGPDEAAFFGGGPKLVADGGTSLDVQPSLDWPFIQLLAKASVDARPGLPVVHLDGGITLEEVR